MLYMHSCRNIGVWLEKWKHEYQITVGQWKVILERSDRECHAFKIRVLCSLLNPVLVRCLLVLSNGHGEYLVIASLGSVASFFVIPSVA